MMRDSTRSTRGRSNATAPSRERSQGRKFTTTSSPQVQTLQPLAAPARGLPAGLKVGVAGAASGA